MTAPDISATAAASHDIRSLFEKCAFLLFIVVIAAICAIAVIGVLWPPPALAGAPDWGKAIVDRVSQLKDSIFDMLVALSAPLGISITRGHLDEGLKAKSLAQFVNGDGQ